MALKVAARVTRYRLHMMIPPPGHFIAPARDTIDEARQDALASGNAVKEPDGRIVVLVPAEIKRVS